MVQRSQGEVACSLRPEDEELSEEERFEDYSEDGPYRAERRRSQSASATPRFNTPARRSPPRRAREAHHEHLGSEAQVAYEEKSASAKRPRVPDVVRDGRRDWQRADHIHQKIHRFSSDLKAHSDGKVPSQAPDWDEKCEKKNKNERKEKERRERHRRLHPAVRRHDLESPEDGEEGTRPASPPRSATPEAKIEVTKTRRRNWQQGRSLEAGVQAPVGRDGDSRAVPEWRMRDAARGENVLLRGYGSERLAVGMQRRSGRPERDGSRLAARQEPGFIPEEQIWEACAPSRAPAPPMHGRPSSSPPRGRQASYRHLPDTGGTSVAAASRTARTAALAGRIRDFGPVVRASAWRRSPQAQVQQQERRAPSGDRITSEGGASPNRRRSPDAGATRRCSRDRDHNRNRLNRERLRERCGSPTAGTEQFGKCVGQSSLSRDVPQHCSTHWANGHLDTKEAAPRSPPPCPRRAHDDTEGTARRPPALPAPEEAASSVAEHRQPSVPFQQSDHVTDKADDVAMGSALQAKSTEEVPPLPLPPPPLELLASDVRNDYRQPEQGKLCKAARQACLSKQRSSVAFPTLEGTTMHAIMKRGSPVAAGHNNKSRGDAATRAQVVQRDAVFGWLEVQPGPVGVGEATEERWMHDIHVRSRAIFQCSAELKARKQQAQAMLPATG
jgi:hypothetical protein